MDKYIDKDIIDELSPTELEELKTRVNSGIENMDQDFARVWLDSRQTDDPLTEDVRRGLSAIKAAVLRQAMEKKRKNTWRKTAKWTVGVLSFALALLLTYSVLQIKRDKEWIESQEIAFVTGPGEKASISLPDGTKVALNHTSSLRYKPSYFNENLRQVEFTGEGYFEVTKDADKPFIVHAPSLDVEVLGTTFNLRTYDNTEFAELALHSGEVVFTSLRKGSSVDLNPGEVARMSFTTGDIQVIRDVKVSAAAADWRKGELVFRNESFASVLEIISKNYLVDIQIDNGVGVRDTFTGALPANDLNKAFDILEYVFDVNFRFSGETVHVSK